MIAGFAFLALAALFLWGAIGTRRSETGMPVALGVASFMSTVWGVQYTLGLETWAW